MTSAMALELRQDLETLIRIMQIWTASEKDPRQVRYLQSSIQLIDTALARLKALLAGATNLKEPNVYLYVNSLNKGLNEIGANWQDDPRITAAITTVTKKAYDYYKMTR
jgi:hypothetical protein